ncbi:MAG TPA: patatin-like phospholipase family protein [Pyrinomonadaceae bacterium]|nr:patatin-like phospholipase family protein [Acidobacteriota bacterium]HQZ96225.1 patatin-like phospholipase family protein [Pyrinomonadaceae bacterium]
MPKKIGLALSGGGARGFAHIGVLKVLVENNVPIDMIAGTSAGSIIGGAFASGMSIEDILAMAEKVGWTNMTRPSMSPIAMLSNAPMGRFLASHFPVTRFEGIKIPFAAVACDLRRGEEVVLRDKGDMIFAIQASCAVPGVFAPMTDEKGRTLIDGGAVSLTPTNAVRQLGADVVIAVDLLACGSNFLGKPRTALGMILQSALILLSSSSKNQSNQADVSVEPRIAHLRADQIGKRAEFIALGEAIAQEKLGEILAAIQ